MKRTRSLRTLAWVLAALLLLFLVGPFLVPVPPLEGTSPANGLADADSRFMELNGLDVHYKIAGEGEPAFVLLHGFGASLFSWHAVMEPLGRLGSVIAYDRPAFGLTERPMQWEGQDPYGMQSNVELLLGLLDAFGLQKAILVGNSAGGTVAMEFALQYPERVAALILVDPAVYAGGGPAWVRTLGNLPQVQHLGPLLVRSIQSQGLEMLDLAWHDPGLITQETIDGYTRPLQVDDWDRALWYYTLASERAGLAERLGGITLPVLVITGDDDRIVPTEDSIRLAGELPQAELAVIPAAGHVPHEERPDLFMEAVDSFVRSLP